MRPFAPVFVALSFAACTGGHPQSQASSQSAEPPGSQSQTAPPAAPSEEVPDAPSAAPVASAEPALSASAEPAPKPALVTVKNIGLHIGGGPNDGPTKAPIKRSVEPHFDAIGACFDQADDKTKAGDISIDLRIEKEGGKAKVQKYKSAIKGAAFETCVRDVFGAIDFEKPKGGSTIASYSVRLTLEEAPR